MGTERLETFGDGVFAIAATPLVERSLLARSGQTSSFSTTS
ncbi:MAG TPA: hypothetical protein VF186_02965 [Gaiellaceae bacterium]